MNVKKTSPQSCRSTNGESSRTIHVTNVPLRRWPMGLRTSVCGLGLDFSVSVVQIGRPPPSRIPLGNRTPPTCSSVKAESTGASHAANAPLRRRRVSVRAFVVMVLLYFLAWFGFGGLEGRRRKKAVSRRLRRRGVLYIRHSSITDLMVEICF
ncbi:hypothetical protein Cgig2_033536 [Carnegiea gigantea]|uniref:Transmembrane protein n=1 Tax=Carnegiea gigantea TaxID=171969 RepID=A0A9Q1K1J0_9CARY|nr:hypothetical protein Cgig2_033536 [Carnegiea gigantea]